MLSTYWAVRLGYIYNFSLWCIIVSVATTLLWIIAALLCNDLDLGETILRRLKKYMKVIFPIFILGILGLIFCPDKKESLYYLEKSKEKSEVTEKQSTNKVLEFQSFRKLEK